MAVTNLAPSDIAARWSAGMGAAGPKIQAGVEAVKSAPGAAAAANKAGYVQGVTSNADKWAARVGSVTLSSWQQDFINKGLPRIATGATAAEPKFTNFMNQFLPFLRTTVANLPPRGGFAANVNRMVAQVTAAHSFSYKK